MARDYVHYAVEEDIAVATINHPPVNALDQKTVLESGQVIDELEKKPEADYYPYRGGRKGLHCWGISQCFLAWIG